MDHLHCARLLIGEGYRSCREAHQVGQLAASLGFETLNVKLKTNRLHGTVAAFASIANEVVELTKQLEKSTDEYLVLTTHFVKHLLQYMRYARTVQYFELARERMKKTAEVYDQDDTFAANAEIRLQGTFENTESALLKQREQTYQVYTSLVEVCRALQALIKRKAYAISLARVEASRHSEQITFILPSLESIASFISEINLKISRIRDGLDAISHVLSEPLKQERL